MRCKYCDYENPKEAIVCECCGATLATQRSIEFYKKEARKRKRQKAEKKIKPRKRDTEKKKDTRLKITKKGVLAVALTLALVLAGLIVSLIISVIDHFRGAALYEDIFAYDNETAVPVYYPESGEYRFLLHGEFVPGSVKTDAVLYSYGSQNSVTIFVGSSTNEAGEYDSVIAVVYKDGIKIINMAGINVRTTGYTSYVTDDGESFLICILMKDKYYLYSCQLTGDGALTLMGEYATTVSFKNPKKSLDSRAMFTAGGKLCVYDCKTKELSVLADEVVDDVLLREERGCGMLLQNTRPPFIHEMIYYRIDTGESVSLGWASTCVLSPDGMSVAYSVVGENTDGIPTKIESYVYKDGESISIGEGFEVLSINNDLSVIYGYNEYTQTLISITANGERRNIAEGKTKQLISGDGNEMLLLCDGSLYLSKRGEYPIRIEGSYSNVSKMSACADGFTDGLLAVTSKEGSYVCRLDRSYRMIPFSTVEGGVYSHSYSKYGSSKDGRTLLYGVGGCIYKYEEGVDKKPVFIGNSMGDSFSSSLNGIYMRHDALFFSGKDGSIKIISDECYSYSDFNGVAIVMEENDRSEEMPEFKQDPESEETDGAGDKKKDEKINAYSLYYSVNGGKLRLLKKNIDSYKVTANTLYVYVRVENEDDVIEGGSVALYDVYAGSDVHRLKLVAKKVAKRDK
ncbi:MAG: hypothetical protein J6D45_06465 [Clostridia bacterium]|nr:hypothetical protein [Clostridia bacterium]